MKIVIMHVLAKSFAFTLMPGLLDSSKNVHHYLTPSNLKLNWNLYPGGSKTIISGKRSSVI